MKQFGTILKFELTHYMKNKIFAGVTVLLVAVIAAVMFFPRIMDSADDGAPDGLEMAGSQTDGEAAGDVEDMQDDPAIEGMILLAANGAENADLMRQAFAEAFPDYEVCLTEDETEEIKDKVASGMAERAFVMDGPTSYTYYVDTLSMYDMNTEIADEVLANLYRMDVMQKAGMAAEDVQAALNVQMEHETESLGTDQMQNFFYTYIMIFALYMVILLYGQMVATNVATEKSSRAMELLITSAKPVSMMFGKVLASCLAGLIQILLVFGSAIVFYQMNRDYWDGNRIIASIFDMPVALFGYMIVFFVLGFLIYAFLFGAIGSMASKVEDINTSVMPLTLLFVAGFLVVMMSLSSGSVDSLLIRICSYVPFTSPMAMFTRIAMSEVPFYEIALSIAVLIASVAGVGVVSAKIYRVGVLLYGTKPKIRDLLRAAAK